MSLNGIPDFTVLVRRTDGGRAFVSFPLVEANIHFETMRANGAIWTVVDGPCQWGDAR